MILHLVILACGFVGGIAFMLALAACQKRVAPTPSIYTDPDPETTELAFCE